MPSGSRRYLFQVGKGGVKAQRDIEVSYARDGAPQSLVETITRMTPEGAAVAEGIAVTFRAGRVRACTALGT
jgi:hypothetical protein